MTHVDLSPSDVERFWSYVDRASDKECWQWTGAKWGNPRWKDNLYGRLGVMVGAEGHRKQVSIRAHRISFYLTRGYWPAHHVLHSCDNPLCVNPAHLSEGTVKENAVDMMAKGRGDGQFKIGHKGFMGSARITQEIADKIRAEYVPYGRTGGGSLRPDSLAGLARKYGVSKRAVLRIVQGKTWR